MKDKLLFALAALIVASLLFGVLYLAAAFVGWSLNPATWSTGLRFLVAAAALWLGNSVAHAAADAS